MRRAAARSSKSGSLSSRAPKGSRAPEASHVRRCLPIAPYLASSQVFSMRPFASQQPRVSIGSGKTFARLVLLARLLAAPQDLIRLARNDFASYSLILDRGDVSSGALPRAVSHSCLHDRLPARSDERSLKASLLANGKAGLAGAMLAGSAGGRQRWKFRGD
jgi:hypothetical protein